MVRSTGFRARRLSTSAVALCMLLSATLTTSAFGIGVAGAAKEKVDKNAVLRLGVPWESQGPAYFDPSSPRATTAQTPRMWMDLIYGTMIVQTEDGKGEPGLATKWKAVDPQTIELTLRDGVKFSDGAPFNADAVKAAWDRLITGSRANKFADIQAMQSVDKVDDKTVRIHLNKPIATDFINDTLKNSASLGVPSPTAAAAGTLDTKPVGAGPYMFDSYQTGKVTLKRNPSYYDKASQKLAGFEFDDLAVGPPSVSALQAGTIDLTWQFPPDAINTLKAQPGITVYSAPSPRQYQMTFCGTQGVFANKTARQALQYAIDRDALNKAVLNGVGTPNQLLLTPDSPYYNKSMANTFKYDPKKAKALLKQAGVAPGTKVTMIVANIPPFPAFGELVQSNLKDVGLDLEIIPTTNYTADSIRLKPDLFLRSEDPGQLSLYWDVETAANVCAFHSDALVSGLNATKDPTKTGPQLQAAWDTLQKSAFDESMNIITNLFGALVAYNDKVKGVTIVNSPYGPQLSSAYMVK
jgi:ABC-type transport system substrate-binding protein